MANKFKGIKTADDLLNEELKDPKFAAEYLNAYIPFEDAEDEELFLQAISKIIEIHGVTNFSKGSDIPRRTLYAAFSGTGNPRFKTLTTVLDYAGISMQFVPKKAIS